MHNCIFDSTGAVDSGKYACHTLGGMSNGAGSSQSPDDAESRARIFARAVQGMLDAVPSSERETFIRMLADTIRSQGVEAKGGLASTIANLLLKSGKSNADEITVEEIKKSIEEHGVKATDKQVFNAVGYLTRKGQIKRVGYGRYVVDGLAFVGLDDLGGQPSITEGDLDD